MDFIQYLLVTITTCYIEYYNTINARFLGPFVCMELNTLELCITKNG